MLGATTGATSRLNSAGNFFGMTSIRPQGNALQMRCQPNPRQTREVYKRTDGKFAFRVKASNGEVVATDGGQGYSNKAKTKSTLEKLMRDDHDGNITEL